MLDSGYFVGLLNEGRSEEFVRRVILAEFLHEIKGKEPELSDYLYPMFIWGEVVRQQISHETSHTTQ